MSDAVRSEPLGWLAPLVVAPPAAVLGALIGADDDSLARPLVGALTAGLVAALSGCWGVRERRPGRLFGRFAASAMLGGGIGVVAACAGFDLASSGRLGWNLWQSGMVFAYGAMAGLVVGAAAGLWLALMLRLRRGPARTRRTTIVAGAGWVAAAAALLATEPDAFAPALVLLLSGLTTLVLSPLLGARDGLPPAAADAVEAAPYVAGRGRIGALLLLGPGFVLGLVVLERVVPPPMTRGGLDLLAASVVPALLAAMAGAWSMRGQNSSLHIGVRALIACLFAGAVCAPLSYLALVAAGTRCDLEELGLVSVLGGGIGVPIGLALGVPFSVAAAALSRLSRGTLARPIGRAWLGAVWLAGGAAAIGLTVLFPDRMSQWSSNSPPELTHAPALATALVVMALGVGVAGTAALRLARAWRLLSQARKGRLPEYAVVARSELEADDATIAALPAYLPFGRLDAVLVRRFDPRSAPFRDATVSEPLARVPG